MNLIDLTPEQLKRAASIKEQIAALNKELIKILGNTANGRNENHPRTLSPAAKRRIAAAQKARWARFRGAKAAALSRRPATKRETTSAAAKARLSAKLKSRAARKSGRK